jgi:NADPH2 dehydrogenase
MKSNPLLLQEQNIRGYHFKNRYVCAPFDIAKATKEGLVTDELLSIYQQRKGPSMIIVEQAAIAPEGQYRNNLLFADREETLEGLAKLAQRIHQNQQIAVLQINHAGSAADPELTKRELLAPSPVEHPVFKRGTPRGLTVKEIQNIKALFVKSAERAIKAGFDGLEIHSCHGFLLSQFLSPITNQRRDQYGGSLENRSRLLFEILREVRETIGKKPLLLVRLGVDDLLPGGVPLKEGITVAKRLEATIDILDVSTGLTPPLVLPGPAMLREHIKEVKKAVSIPVIGAGELEDPVIAQDMVKNREVDFIALGRAIMNQDNYVEDLIVKIQKQ